MNPSQRKLVWSWIIGGITLSITLYIVALEESYAWVIPMFIGMPIVKYLREGIDNDKNDIFHHMSERMKLYTAIYLFSLAGYVIYSLSYNPNEIGSNVDLFIILALLPFLVVFLKIDLKLFRSLGVKNA